MDDNEVNGHAWRIANDHLDDGIDFCVVYEDDELADVDGEDQERIHSRVNYILRSLI